MSNNLGNEEEPRLKTMQEIITSESAIAGYKYKLTSDFFEKVLECEVKLKEKFDPIIFYDLLNYYSKAIGYYESMNDPKFLIYNQALNYLFDQPEAKKFLAGKDLGKEFRKKELIKRFKQCEKIVTEEKVKKFVEKKTNDENIKSSIDKLYNKDMDRQKESFMKKREEKKLKYNERYKNREKAKNKSDNNVEEIKLSDENNNNDKNINNKKNDIKKEEKINDETFKYNGGEGIFDLDNIEEQEEISEIDFNIDDVVVFVNIAKEENKEKEKTKEKEKEEEKEEEKEKEKNNNDNIEDNKNEDKSDSKEETKANSSKNNYFLQKSIKMTNKTKFYEKMKENFDNYFKEYYEYFINNNYIDLISKDFEENEIEITQKVIETGVNFLNQIKDMECLLDNKDNEESYKKEISNIINQLKGEQKSNIDKIFSESKEKLKTYNNKYLINNTLLKEKFKLDTTKSLNTFIFK